MYFLAKQDSQWGRKEKVVLVLIFSTGSWLGLEKYYILEWRQVVGVKGQERGTFDQTQAHSSRLFLKNDLWVYVNEPLKWM